MFKIGDVVVCVEAKHLHLTLGKEYVVVDNNLWCHVINDRNNRAGYFLRRFKLKEQEKELTYDELYEQARELGVVGRGRMNKAELIIAIDNYKNKPPVPKPVVESLGVQLRNKTGDRPGTCSYAYRTENGNNLHVCDVCHARLRSESPMLEIALDVAGHYNNHSDKEAYKAFVMWMLVSSPFKDCFLTKSWEATITSCVMLDVTKPHSHNVTAAIALRAGSEFPERAIQFNKLINSGYSGAVAWVMSAYFREDKDKFLFRKLAASHDVHHENIPFDVFKAFVKNGFVTAGDSSNVDATSYSVIESISGISEYEMADNNKTTGAFLRNAAGVKLVGEGWRVEYNKISSRVLYSTCEKLEEAFK